MAQSEMIRCQECECEVSRDESLVLGNRFLCEDCYIKTTHRIQTCDPLAVRSAKLFRETSGLEATEGLTELQKAICEYIKSKGKVTAEDLISTFDLSPQELENQLAILRHCELIKGQKEVDVVYVVPF